MVTLCGRYILRMNRKPKIKIDDNIPYINGRLEPVAEVEYLDQFGFNPESISGADALIIRTRTQCNAALLENSDVKLIATATIGTDQIDIPWCEGNGIEVHNSPGCNAQGVAQYVWASLLREGFDPKGSKIGVIGCGNVGTIVSRWGEQLGAEVWISDPPRQEAGVPGNYHSLDDIFRECDAVTLHTPLIKDGVHPTCHLVGDRELNLLKDGAYFVNAARGAVVDNDALLRRVKRGGIKTIIDTWEGEPQLNRELLELVDIGTFHIAGYSRQGKERATRMVIEAVENFFDVKVDKSGLADTYVPLEKIEAQGIIDSYDPYVDSRALKAAPGEFDILRRDYNYRGEYNGL